MPRMRVAAIIAGLLVAIAGTATAASAQPLSAERAAELKKMILPQEGENRFWRIDWLEDVWEARQKAAAEGKPIFVWAGSEGAPVTNC